MKRLIISALVVATGFSLLLAISQPEAVAAAAPAATQACGETFFGLPTWYRGLVDAASCEIVEVGTIGLGPFIWTIVLNIIDIILRLVGLISVGFILFGGFLYLTSAGSAEGITKAKRSITNAVVGLVLSIASVAIVNLIAGAIK